MNLQPTHVPSLILVEDSADDEALSLRSIAKSGVPCQVEVIRDGRTAKEWFHSHSSPTPALILLDYHLPGFNGLEVLRALRSDPRTRLIPVVIFSSLASDANSRDCLTGGANSVVEKPTDVRKYVEDVAYLLRYWLNVHRITPSGASNHEVTPGSSIARAQMKLDFPSDSSVFVDRAGNPC